MNLARLLHFRILVPLFALPLLVALVCACSPDDDTQPTLDSTPSQTAITSTGATLGGNGTDGGDTCDNDKEISSRGIYYSKTSENPKPTLGGTGVTELTEGGSGNGKFSIAVTGLDPDTAYSFRAWVTSDGGTSRSDVGIFTTLAPGVATPSVSDATSANLTVTGATLGGNLTAAGTSAVTELGVVLSATNADPVIDAVGVTKVVGTGTALGVFTVPVTGLTANTEYTFKVYATNTDGTAYTAYETFTPQGPPLVAALEASGISPTGATLGGRIENTGGSDVTARGVVYSLTSANADPLLDGTGVTKTSEVPESGAADEFSFPIDSLQSNTLYSYKSFATTANGTGYSESRTFRTRAIPADLTALTGLAGFTDKLSAQTARAGAVPGTTLLSVEGNSVTAAVAQPDGKFLVGGTFTTIGGAAHGSLARLLADGSVDPGFVAASGLDYIATLAVQKDGKILVGAGGDLVRLNPDGSLDTGFSPLVEFGYIQTVVLQPDGKILFGGAFLQVNGLQRYWLTRLNRDGTLDPDFTAYEYDSALGVNIGVNSVVDGIAVQGDGKILIWGDFGEFGTPAGLVPTNHITRLNANGTLDTTFNPGTGPDGFTYVRAAVLQPDGKILIAGQFTSFNGTPRNRVARLLTNGSIDFTFDPGAGPDAEVVGLALQADGRILIAGAFANVAGTARAGVARLEANGALDASSDPGAGFGQQVNGLALREDGRILILGGDYHSPTPPPRDLIKLVDNDAATQSLTSTATSAKWLRGGSSPEVSGVVFKIATAAGVTPLGNAVRIPGGWELTGIAVPASGILLARGRTTGGHYNGGSGVIERLLRRGAAHGAPPEVSTPLSLDLTATGATLGGTVTSAGASAILRRGVVYDFAVENGPQFPNGITTEALGTALGAFTVDIEDLVPGKSYAFAAYAASAEGTGFSEVAFFNTPGPAKVTSPTSADLTDVSVTLGGDVTSDGGGPITERGVYYGPAALGEVDRLLTTQVNRDNLPKVTDPGTTGPFTVSVTGLDPETKYSFAAYAVNATGTFVSPIAEFMTEAAAPGPAPPEGGPEGGPAGGPEAGSFLSGGGSSGSAPGGGGAAEAGIPAGTLDLTYDPDVTANRFIKAIAVQPDGKSLIAGNFDRVGGGTHQSLARFRTDGSVDHSFNANANGAVNSVALHPDGRILIGGAFSEVNGVLRNGIAQITRDGVLVEDSIFSAGAGADSVVYSVALQSDGKILLGGIFTSVQGTARNGIARLKANGRLDLTFDPGSGANEAIYSLAVQSDGKILVGGFFTSFDGTTCGRIVRLDSDGGVDGGFNPGSGANDRVTAISIQEDNRILVAGYFTTFNGATRSRIARLEANGTLDGSFDTVAGPDDRVYSMAQQLDGSILIGGLFQFVNGTARNRIARLDSGGQLDPTFDPGMGADGEVDAVTLQEDGSVLIGGIFDAVDGVERDGVARFLNEAATGSLMNPSKTLVQWLRGGAGPLTSDVVFDLSTDGGLTWEDLGEVSKIAGGWQLNGPRLPVNGLVRAMGTTNGGFLGGSSGLVEEILSFDYGPQIASLQAQLRFYLRKTKIEKRRLQKAKKHRNKKKKVRLIKRSKKNLRRFKIQQRRISAGLRAVS